MMLAFDAVLFDLGGTLIYFDGDWNEILPQADVALLRVLQSAGLELDEQSFLTDFRRHLELYYRERETEFIEHTTLYVLRTLLDERGFSQVPEPTLRLALDAMYAVTQTRWKVEPDAVPMLAELKDQGYRLGLISNAGDDDDVQVLVDQAQLRPYFDTIVTSAALGIRKPNPRIFHEVLAPWGIPPARAAMVGDTLGADVLGAQNAGIFSIWITRRADTPANRAHADTIQPDAILATLAELPPLLRSLSPR
jgi:HAD superfamily hydrolase (TIGR01549 family)